MSEVWRTRLRRILPWIISAAALIYVFGWKTDWERLVEATRNANLPVFIAIAFADKMLFFLGWTALQVTSIRRLVGQISVRALFSLRGGSELLRAVSNPLADATFLVGLVHLTGGRAAVVLVAASVPAFVHVTVMLLQATAALPFLEGGPSANRDVLTTVVIGWTITIGIVVSVRTARSIRWEPLARVRHGIEQIDVRQFLPMLRWFVVLAMFDVTIQYFATRAFGIPIPWAALAARIPLLYLAISIPSFGNFGTRELAWAGLFGEFGDRDALIAYAFATNAIFLVSNVMIGVFFLPRAIQLVREMREARRTGEDIPKPPLLHDPGES